MEQATMNTPVHKCEHLSLYAQTMFSKFTQVNELADLGEKLRQATNVLLAAHTAYAKAVTERVIVRVQVKYADFMADGGVKMAKRAAELADGPDSTRITSHLFPNGTTPIIKPVGDTQVTEMQLLEERYDSIAATYPGAVEEKAKIVALRKQYDDALKERRGAAQKTAGLRAARDLAKEDFLDVYAEVAARVKAIFPRNKKMQDLFFDKVRVDPVVDNDEPDVEEDAIPTNEPSPT